MSKIIRVDDKTYKLLDDLRFSERKRSIAAVLAMIFDDIFPEEDENGTEQSDLDDYDEDED